MITRAMMKEAKAMYSTMFLEMRRSGLSFMYYRRAGKV